MLTRQKPNSVKLFPQSQSGVAAIEFALILPFLLMLYIYTVEFSRAFDEKRKVDHLASTISDIVSQQSTGKPIPDASVASLLEAGPVLMSPFSAQKLTSTVSVVNLAVRSDGTCCDARTRWSYSQGGSLRPCGALLSQVSDDTPPSPSTILASAVGSATGAPTPGDVVVTDVSDSFSPIFKGLFLFFGSGFQRTAYLSARSAGQLSLQTPVTTPAGQQAQVC